MTSSAPFIIAIVLLWVAYVCGAAVCLFAPAPALHHRITPVELAVVSAIAVFASSATMSVALARVVFGAAFGVGFIAVSISICSVTALGFPFTRCVRTLLGPIPFFAAVGDSRGIFSDAHNRPGHATPLTAPVCVSPLSVAQPSTCSHVRSRAR
jgi:hypothetical protein